MPVLAQNESGRRFLDEEAFRRSSKWYDSTAPVYLQRHPIIRTIPPLNTGMPHEVMSAYVRFDSIARFTTDAAWAQNSPALIAKPELLRVLAANHYYAVDYNPILFKQYQRETALKSDIFKLPVGMFTIFLPAALKASASNASDRNRLMSIMSPDYVLRIKVVAVDTVAVSATAFEPAKNVFNVTAQVLDTLKGQVFASCSGTSLLSGSSATPASESPCIRFYYTPNAYFKDPELELKEDDAFLTADGKFSMEVGQEAVVFLRLISKRIDYENDYFELTTDPRGSYNALPIIDGNVRDINHIWSNEDVISYDIWRNKFFASRKEILMGTY